MTPRPRPRWLAAIALSIVGLAGSRAADATVLSVDYVTIKVPVGNNLIHGACARISPGGLPQHTEQLTATAWNNGANGIPQNGSGDDKQVVGATFQWSMIGGAPGDTLWDAYSGHRSLTDSPNGEYANNRNVAAEINPTFNLTGAGSAELRFRHHYASEPGYDYCIVEYKKNAGAWTQLASYNGTGGAPANYLPVTLPLTAALGGQCKLRFRFTSDVSVTDDGWHLDDIEVYIDGSRVFFDDLESGIGNYTVQAPWGLEVPQIPQVLGTIDQAGLFTAGGKTGTAYVIAGATGATSDTIDVRIVPPDWVAGP